MSERKSNDAIIDEFLDRVEEKLPQWLKDRKQELNDTLAELREHVLDKAAEIAGSGDFGAAELKKAIEAMGSPETIAQAYKRRGTPKVFISKELWPYYLRFLAIIAVIVVVANVATGIVAFQSGEADALLAAASRVEFGLCGVFTVITIVFMWLSAQGYFPEDFDEKPEIKVKDGKQVVKPKSIVNRAAKFVGAGIELFIGIVAVTLPFPGLVALINPAFTLLIRCMGAFWLASGVITMCQGLVGTKRLRLLQALMFAGTAMGILGIMFLVPMIRDPSIVPMILWVDDTVTVSAINPAAYPGVAAGLSSVIVIVVIASAIDAIETILLPWRLKHSRA